MGDDPQFAKRVLLLNDKIEIDIAGDRKCALMSVCRATDDDDQNFLPFTYTIGLTDIGWPELIIAGLGGVTAGTILNAVVTRCLTDLGPPIAGVEIKKIANYPVRLQSISDEQRDEYLRWSVARQERVGGPEPQVLQVVFPDPNGKWPDDPKCEAKTAFVQQLPTDEQLERVQ